MTRHRRERQVSVVLALAVAGSAPLAAQFTSGEQTQLVAAHNVVRHDVEPVAMPLLPGVSWSSSLASIAQTHANGCIFAHSAAAGENLYASTGNPNLRPTPIDIVGAWGSEGQYYVYSTNGCSAPNPPGTCGHYTQMVRRPATAIGCGIRECTPATTPFTQPPFNGYNWYLVVCQYNVGQTGATQPYLCDYDGNGSATQLCSPTFFADGFEQTQALPGNWGGKAP